MSSLDLDYMMGDIYNYENISDSEKEIFKTKLEEMGIL